MADANAAALDKALEALSALLSKADESLAARQALQALCLSPLALKSPLSPLQILDSNKFCLSGQVQQQCFLPAAGLTLATVCRIAGPVCSNLAGKVLKQRPGTIQRAKDVCLEFCELEQGEAVVVGNMPMSRSAECANLRQMPA